MKFFPLALFTSGLIAMTTPVGSAELAPIAASRVSVASFVTSSPQLKDGKYQNTLPVRKETLGQLLKLAWTFAFNKPKTTVPTGAIPVQPLSREQLLAAPDDTVFRLGHSTMLLKMGGLFYLTDPVFSQRASPLQWMGPARFHQPPISLQDLPPIEAIILSHDHYDHLDHAAVLALAPNTRQFITPLGVGDRLIAWGIPAAKVRQLDWWESVQVADVTLVATPARHFSGRSVSDRDSTLWASWVLQHGDTRVFFSGDSGYFDGFKKIGERFGPFDLAMIETGAYDAMWPDVHMQPEQTMQAFIDLNGKVLMPVHNGTFDLGLHRWQEPLERIVALAAAQGVVLATPQMGQPLAVRTPAPALDWWSRVDQGRLPVAVSAPAPAQPR